GRILATTNHGVGYLENDRFVPVDAVPGGLVEATAGNGQGGLWISNQNLGLLRLSPQGEVRQIPWAGLGHTDFATTLATDPLQHGLWLGFYNGGVAYFADGGVQASYRSGDGLGEGHVTNLQVDLDGTLWAATGGGLSRLRNGHVATLSSKNGLPC